MYFAHVGIAADCLSAGGSADIGNMFCFVTITLLELITLLASAADCDKGMKECGR
jgi:hypothetical protein